MLKQELIYNQYDASNFNALQSYYIKQNIVESEEEIIGLGLSNPITKTYYVIDDKPYTSRPRLGRSRETLFN